jgi:hypothetical protein
MLGYPQTLITSQVDGPTLVAAAAASMLPPSAVYGALQPNFFDRLGQQLVIEASGRISSLITTPGTARFDVRLGSSVVFDSQAILLDTVAAHVNVGWHLRIKLTCRSLGPTATLLGQGWWMCEDILGTPAAAPKGVLTAILPWNTPPVVGATFNSKLAQELDVFFTQTAATGSLICHQYELSSPN